MCQKTFVLPPPSQIVQLCMSKECVEPQPVEPFDHRGVQPGDVSKNENRAERRALVADYREVKEARISTNSNYCDVARRCYERRGGTKRRPRQTNTFQEKVPATDSLLKRRRSTPHNVFSRFRLCSNRIIEHNNQVCSLLLLLRSICSLRCRLVTTGSHARLVVVEKTEKY